MLGVTTTIGVLLLSRDAAPVPLTSSVTSRGHTGASSDGFTVWSRNADGSPVRWDPCSPIRIEVSGRGAPAAYPRRALLADVEHAVERLRRVSGLELIVIGTSDDIPAADRPTRADDSSGTPRWAPVLIGWRAPGTGDLPLRDVDRAVAIPVAVGPASDRTYVTGQIALNSERTDLRPGTADRAISWGATILHELAHVLGLGHADDPEELLHTFPGSGPVELGPGDRAGLQAVGADGGCRRTPAPRELDVELPRRR